ncbi:MAG: IS200/IS605 family transposase [Ignavibacteria bacterium]|mgnify:CR=1 FL=1|nr:IS200/IS605 family transposase [Ignavibacteria bacterium]
MSESKYIHKAHNVSVLLYHFVCPAKYRRVVFSPKVDEILKETCLEIAKRYQVNFLEIGTDTNHVHFLVQSVPTYSSTKIITIIKSITAREIFKQHPEVKKQLWGGEHWTDGYFVNTVSKFGDENTISKYVREQGLESEYKILHKTNQLTLF